MKKIFLIPLVAFFACATAWATNPTTADDLQAAVNAATDNVATTITLGGPISSEGTIVSIPSGKVITLDLKGWSLSSTAANDNPVPAIINEGVLHLQGAGSISSPNNIAIFNGASEFLSWLQYSSSPKRRAMARKAMLENDDPTEPWITFSGSFNVNGGERAVINVMSEDWLSSGTITFLSDYTGQVTGSVEDLADWYGTKENIKVNGGKFSEDISENATIAEGYHIELVEDWYTLVEGAAYVAQVGENEYATLTEALTAAEENATITLLKDADEDVTIAKSVTLTGGKKIKGSVTIDGNITLTMAGVTIESSSDAITFNGDKTLNIVAQGETENAVYARHVNADCFFGMDNCVLNISGDGNLEVEGYVVFHVKKVNISARNLAAWGTLYDFAPASQGCSYSITAGGYKENPDQYLSAPYYTTHTDLYYRVANVGANVAVCNHVAYATLAEAVDAANTGDEIVLYADPETLAISKEVTIQYGSHNVSGLTAGSDYRLINNAGVVNIIPASIYDLVEFLTMEGTHSFEVSANTDLSKSGQIVVNGTKTLTIPADKTITYKRQTSGANILVAAGAKLTILGSGTIRPIAGADINDEEHPAHAMYEQLKANESVYDGNRAIDVNGELVVGVKDDANNCPHFVVTSIARGNAIMINASGTATFNNANIETAICAIRNYGTTYINGGTYVSTATTKNGANKYFYSYCIRNDNKLVLKNAKVVGNHGAVSCETGNGTMEIHNCDLQARDLTGKGGVHYALYVCTKAMVSAYNTKFYSENGSYTIVIGDNDSQNSFGLIYLYDGCKTNRKLYVQKKRGQDDDILFPVLVSKNSEWYTLALNGGKDENGKLLPANCEYVAINEGEDGYAAGYRYKVVSTATETASVDENATTIPWQQSSTWDANKASTDTEEVPKNTTVVTIPAGKTVVVSADEDKNNGITKAVAEQIFIGDGAKLTVEAGTTLTVGEGGVNIANGGQMIVKDGAVVRVGASGLVTTEEKALVIENTQTKAGVFMIDPAVTENTQPKATVKLESKAYYDETNDIFHWQHFAIPTVGVPDEFRMPVATAIYDLDENNAWKTLSGMSELGTPFKGYNLTNWATAKGTVYEFYGNIIGNGDGKANFTGRGYNFCGNSYTAPIDIVKMLQDIKNNTTVDVEPTITIYDTENDKYQAVTLTSIENASWMGTPVFTQIAPMQGFFLNLRTNEAGEYEVIDYSNSVWGNPSIATGGMLAPARHEANDNKGIRMVVAANGREDDVLMVEKAEYTATFDDGADATKKMSERSFNLYANINNEKQAVVATNNMENMLLGFESVEGGEYTISFYTNDVEGEYYLLDVLTGTKMAIANGAEYTFTQDANVANAVRFEIIGAAKVPTALENVAETATKKGIYTMSGQFVGNDYNALPAGVYVLDGQKIVK